MQDETRPTIPEYFAGKHVFVTGATGFIGKALVEKLLRSCPNIGRIYVLVRPKKGKNPQERIKAMTDLPLYDLLRKTYPDNLQKIVPIIGDVVEKELGLSKQDRQILIDNVNIVYHIAATVRFDEPLKEAVIMNTRGTLETVKLSKEMRNLEVFSHFSTTYCNTDRKVIEEKLYPPHADWRATLELVENMDPHTLDILTAKYMEPLPNTYTFAKSLAEHVVKDLCDNQIPAVIFRPSIVVNTMTDPMPGWIDNFNGPVGILIASGKGVMRSSYAKPDVTADYVPCDSVVKAVIMSTWKKGTESSIEEKLKVSVYNASSHGVQSITMGELVHMGKKLCWEAPLNDIIWYPNGNVTSCWYNNYIKLIFYQLLPALFLDLILMIIGRKPMLIKIHRKIFLANSALSYFVLHEWHFINKKCLGLEKFLLPSDLPAFSLETDSDNTDPYTFFLRGLWGARRYLLHEPDSTMPNAKIHSRRMWLIGQVFNASFYLMGFLLLRYIIKETNWFNSIYTHFSTLDS